MVKADGMSTDLYVYTAQQQFKCEICYKSFLSASFLKKHTRQTHNSVKPHKCDTCNKSFQWVSHLIVHLRVHSGEKPHMCKFCDKSYSAIGPLTYHLRTHTGEKPHTCTICNKSFTIATNMRQHLLTHTSRERPHMCNICNNSYTYASGLKRHLQAHHEDQCTCKICNNIFSRSNTLLELSDSSICKKCYFSSLTDQGGTDKDEAIIVEHSIKEEPSLNEEYEKSNDQSIKDELTLNEKYQSNEGNLSPKDSDKEYKNCDKANLSWDQTINEESTLDEEKYNYHKHNIIIDGFPDNLHTCSDAERKEVLQTELILKEEIFSEKD